MCNFSHQIMNVTIYEAVSGDSADLMKALSS